MSPVIRSQSSAAKPAAASSPAPLAQPKQGFAKPVSDLSRGCSVDDIVITSAITLAQAAAN